MKNVALHNLGCKVNSYEMEVMQQMLQENGFNIVPFDQEADIYIVNTCTVTNIADRKSRQMLHRAKQRNPDAVVVAAGCYAQTARERVEGDPCVDLIVGNNRKKDIVGILEEYLRERGTVQNETAQNEITRNEITQDETAQVGTVQNETAAGGTHQDGTPRDKTLHGTTVLDINRVGEYEEMALRQTPGHTRAFLKIQDGCNQFCSYCLIPYARGRVRSRREENIVAEAERLAAAGCLEVVLTGIHISSYGIDFDTDFEREGVGDYSGQSRLIELVERIHAVPGIRRIRLGSLEPRIVTEEFAGRLAALPKICPHFHLSLQSGCDETLRRMNRHYTVGEYRESVERLRSAFDHPAVTTDVIVGFPGETEEEFARTRDLLERIRLYEMHIFKYSRRAGTRAAGMPDQVPDSVKAARSSELQAMERLQSREFRSRYPGRTAEVLLEESRTVGGRRYLLGHTADYVKIAVPADGEAENLRPNTLVRAEVKDFLTDEILVAKRP